LIIIHWLTGLYLWTITLDCTYFAWWENSDSKRRLTHFSDLPCPLILTQSSTYETLLTVQWTNVIHNIKILKRTFKTSKKFDLVIVFQQFMKTEESYFFQNVWMNVWRSLTAHIHSIVNINTRLRKKTILSGSYLLSKCI
jgi:hypothetical protein